MYIHRPIRDTIICHLPGVLTEAEAKTCRFRGNVNLLSFHAFGGGWGVRSSHRAQGLRS